jgi:transporter family protein
MSAAAFLMFILALRNSKVSPIVVINTFSAAIAVILSVILLKEKLSVTQILGVIMGISGVVLVSL